MQIIGVVNIWIGVLSFRETPAAQKHAVALSSALYNARQYSEDLWFTCSTVNILFMSSFLSLSWMNAASYNYTGFDTWISDPHYLNISW